MQEWLTYEDAANRLGIKTASVKRQARAKKWPRRTMNDGVVQVGIPTERLADSRADTPPDKSGADDAGRSAVRIAVLESELASAIKMIDELRSSRDDWREQAERLSERETVSVWRRLFGR